MISYVNSGLTRVGAKRLAKYLAQIVPSKPLARVHCVECGFPGYVIGAGGQKLCGHCETPWTRKGEA